MAKLAAVVLAAGASDRFGAENKLLAHIGGRPLVRRVVETVLASMAIDVFVVTGYDRPLIESVLADLPVRFIHNDDWPAGMGSSVATGISELSEDIEGAFVVPGDMPFLNASVLCSLVAAFEQHGRQAIVYPATPDGEQRNPVLWPRRFFSKLTELSGPKGAKELLHRPDSRPVAVTVEDGALLADVDTPADLDAAGGALAKGL